MVRISGASRRLVQRFPQESWTSSHNSTGNDENSWGEYRNLPRLRCSGKDELGANATSAGCATFSEESFGPHRRVRITRPETMKIRGESTATCRGCAAPAKTSWAPTQPRQVALLFPRSHSGLIGEFA